MTRRTLIRCLAWTWLVLMPLSSVGYIGYAMWRTGNLAFFLASLAAGLLTTLCLLVLMTPRKD